MFVPRAKKLMKVGGLLLLAISHGCATGSKSIGTTTGMIEVSAPKIYRREQLLNDRLERDAWLRQQLVRADQESEGMQGTISQRSFSGVQSSTTVEYDPAAGNQYVTGIQQQITAKNRDEEKADLQHEIEMIKLKKEKEQIESGTEPTPTPTPSPTPSPTPGAGSGSPGNQAGGNGSNTSWVSPTAPPRPTGTAKEAANALIDLLGSANAPPAQDLLVDRFRAKMAYREEIKAIIAENELDDRHDLAGNTLYKLSSYATVIPGADTGRWAMVHMEVAAGIGSNGQEDELLGQWRADFEAYLNALASERAAAIGDDNYSEFGDAQTLIRLGEFAENVFPECPVGGGSIYLRCPGTQKSTEDQSQVGRSLPTINDPLVFAKKKVMKLIEDSKWSNNPNAFHTLAAAFTGHDLLIAKGLKRCVGISLQIKNRSLHVDTTNINKCLDSSTHAFTYGVIPEEVVERVSDAAAARKTSQISFSLGLLLGVAKFGQFLEFTKSHEALLSAVKRFPFVVGYSDDTKCQNGVAGSEIVSKPGVACFGWAIGPRFGITRDGKDWYLRQAVRGQRLEALVSIPSWWTEAKITVKTNWLGNDPKNNVDVLEEAEDIVTTIPLRGDSSAITAALLPAGLPQPLVTPRSNTSVTVGNSADVLIVGYDLWRSPVVTAGAIRADQVSVLPGMTGIIAHFNKIPDLGEGESQDQELRVWTSAGNTVAGKISFVKATPLLAAEVKSISVRQSYVIKGNELVVSVAPIIPTAYTAIEIGFRRFGEALPKNYFPVRIDKQASAVRLAMQSVDGLVNGEEFETILRVTKNPVDPPTYAYAPEHAILFETAADSKPQLKPATIHPEAQEFEVQVIFPASAAKAYPGFSIKDTKVKVILVGKAYTESSISSVRVSVDGKILRCRISSPLSSDGKVQAFGAVGSKVHFDLENSGNGELDVRVGTLEIKP